MKPPGKLFLTLPIIKPILHFGPGFRLGLGLLIQIAGSALFLPDASAQWAGSMAATVATNTPEARAAALKLGVGRWIWTTNFTDKQTCRFWYAFNLPATNRVRSGVLRITADNLYRVYLDGRQIGEGANWKTLTDYDLVWLLTPGDHVLTVEGFNDGLEAGVLLGLNVEFVNGEKMQILSDSSWRVVPGHVRNWQRRVRPGNDWPAASEVGALGQRPWWLTPFSITTTPPLRPVELHFWQAGWFIVSVLAVCLVALGLSLYLMTQLVVRNRAQQMLERERVRIARDIHDDLGSRLTELLLLGEVSRREQLQDSHTLAQINQICDKARGLSHAMDEVVWAVNSRRDTLRDFVSYVCKHAQLYLQATPIRCRLDVEPEIPAVALDLPVRRNLFLAVKEALNNAAKHSEAGELFLRIHRRNQKLSVVVEDNGKGFDPATADAVRNGMTNMQERMNEVGGTCQVMSGLGSGCWVEFSVPMNFKRPTRWRPWLRARSQEDPEELKNSYPNPAARTSE